MSCDIRFTSAKADAPGLSEDDEDTRDRLKNLRNTSECANEPLEQRSRNDSPEGAPVKLDDPGDNVVTCIEKIPCKSQTYVYLNE